MSWQDELNDLLRTKGRVSSPGRRGKTKPLSNATIEKREHQMFAAMNDLWSLGFKLKSVRSLKKKHVDALIAHWESKSPSASTLQNKISILRTLCLWIDKADMVGESKTLVSNPTAVKRTVTAQYDHSWSAAGIDVEEMLDRVSKYDPRVGMQLRLCHAFFLRVQEAVMLRPHYADKGVALLVRDGTKGGRERLVTIETDYQRQVLEQAKGMALSANGHCGNPNKSLEQNLARVTTVCTHFGLTRAGLGVTPHGLRHEGLNNLFESIAGVPSPVRTADGARAVLAAVPKQLLDLARKRVSEAAGHARISISGAYIGGLIGPRLNLTPHEIRVTKDMKRFIELRANEDALGFLDAAELRLLREKLSSELEKKERQ